MDATLGQGRSVGPLDARPDVGPARLESVDGVRTLWADQTSLRPGPPRAGLVLRMGTVDEPLVLRGVGHLLERLAVGAGPDARPSPVGTTTTTFEFQGRPDELVRAFDALTRRLRDPAVPGFREHREALRTQAATRTGSVGESMLARRYGARSFGAGPQGELGLPALSLGSLTSWAAWFAARGNAVLWMTCPPPIGLRLHLPEGPARALPAATNTFLQHTPAWVTGPDEAVAVSAVVPRGPGVEALVHVLRNRLDHELRARWGAVVPPSVTVEPLTAEHSFLLLLGVLPDGLSAARRAEAVEFVLDLLPALGGRPGSSAPVSSTELAAFAAEVRWKAGRPEGAVDLLGAAAARLLVGLDPGPALAPESTLDAVEVATVAELARQAAATALAMVPAGLEPDAGSQAWAPAASVAFAPMAADAPGESFPHLEKPEIELRLTAEGLVLGPDDPLTFPVAGTDVVQSWDDGRRVIVLADANRVAVEPNVWARGAELVAGIDRLWPADLVVRMGARRAGEAPAQPAVPVAVAAASTPPVSPKVSRRSAALLEGAPDESDYEYDREAYEREPQDARMSPWAAFWWAALGSCVVLSLLLMAKPLSIEGVSLAPILRGLAVFCALGVYANWKAGQQNRR
ncbi:hypothetical protein ACIB24_08795 [Spongisporangium articulatum]|uniref:Insulinase family protein n=1 Tax=Spongisporangium articulatum TaxID=3362603 RepID=A0ABW8ALF9_9ACTN